MLEARWNPNVASVGSLVLLEEKLTPEADCAASTQDGVSSSQDSLIVPTFVLLINLFSTNHFNIESIFS